MIKQRFIATVQPYLNPTQVHESIYDIDFIKLQTLGVKHLFFDVDNTLMSYSETNVSIKCMALFNDIQLIGFDTVMLMSNNSNVDRIEAVAKQLQLPAVTFACKPFVFTMRRVAANAAIDLNEAAMIGDQLLTDIAMANALNMRSIFVEPIDADRVSGTKKLQYTFQKWLMSQ